MGGGSSALLLGEGGVYTTVPSSLHLRGPHGVGVVAGGRCGGHLEGRLCGRPCDQRPACLPATPPPARWARGPLPSGTLGTSVAIRGGGGGGDVQPTGTQKAAGWIGSGWLTPVLPLSVYGARFLGGGGKGQKKTVGGLLAGLCGCSNMVSLPASKSHPPMGILGPLGTPPSFLFGF